MTSNATPAKPFSQSLTVRVNGALMALAALLAGLPDQISAPPLSNLLASLPPHARNVIAAIVGVIGTVNILIRVLKTTGPVAPPKMPGSTALLLLVAVGLIGCSSGAGAARSPLQTAQLGYAQASLAYEAGMLSLQDARAAHLVNDAQWARVDGAQKTIRQYAPLVRSALSLWQSSGAKPDSYDALLAKLSAAFSEITAILGEVKR